MATATTDTSKTKWIVPSQTLDVASSGDAQKVGGTITLNTAGKYLDRNIEIAAAEVNVPASNGAAKSLGYGESTTISAGYVDTAFTVDVNINAAAVTATTGTVSASVSATAGSDGKYPITGTAVATGVAVDTAGYIADGTGTITKGSVGVSGSVDASTLSATSITPGDEQTVTVSAGYYPTDRTVTIKSASDGDKATLKNTATSGVTYTDASASAPVLVSGDYLYIDAGYISAQKISLAQLVPDNASGADAIKAGMLTSISAYDNDGKLITGDIVTRGVSDVSVSGKTVSFKAGYYETDQTKDVDVAVPTIGGTEMTSGTGVADTTAADVSIVVPVGYNETARTITAKATAAALSASATATATVGSLTVGAADESAGTVALTGSAAISGTATAATAATGRAIKGSTTATGSVSGTASVAATLPLFLGDYTIA